MKMLNKMLLSFVSIVLIFGIIIAIAASLDSERELKNLNGLYEERGVSIAKTIDASIMSDMQLHNDSQTIVDRLIASNLGVAMINIHGKAPDGIKIPGYWRGYWILASSNKSNIHLPSNAIDLAVMNTNKYSVASYNENGKPIIDVIYPLHDPSGKAIAIAEIVFDMSLIQSQMLKRNTNIMQIALILTLLAIIATIFKHKVNIDNLENLVKERTSKLEAAFKSLKESERYLSEAQHIAHLGNWEWNIATDKAYWSDELYRIFALEPQELGPTYNEYLNHVHPDDRDHVADAFKKAIDGKTYSIDHRIVLANGEERAVHIQSEVVFNERNIPIRIRGTVQDITERKGAEEKIRQRAEEMTKVLDVAPVAIFIGHDPKSHNITGNWTANELFETEVGENISANTTSVRRFFCKSRELTADELPMQQASLKDIDVSNVELDMLLPSGKKLSLLGSASPLHDVDGRVRGSVGAFMDITERKQTEEALAEIEIARKQEIHHRIKNNLQVISSLLDLQAEKFEKLECIEYSDVLEAFRESQDRVISMALIHEELYKGGGYETLNFSPYIKELAENLFQTYRVGNPGICLKLDLEESAFFDMDVAVPLGMIVNELVTNSFKHAFPGSGKGEIRIELHRGENKEYISNVNQDCNTFILTVSDNGVGIPEHLDIENLDTLGMQLVTTLVDQLDGELELKRDNGTEFTIRFTVSEKDNKYH